MLNQSGSRPRLGRLRTAVAIALAEHRAPEGEVSVLLATDEELRSLNHTFRGLDEATDVLTFPAPDVPGQLGDIAVSMDFAKRGAAARRVSMSEEAAMLALHGALHLAGLDDQTEPDRRLMLQEMNRIAVLAGLTPDPAWSSQPHG